MKRQLHLELLLGREVFKADGEKAGRIEEVVAEQRNGEWIVKEFLIGTFGVMERFSIHHFGSTILRRLGAKGASPSAQRVKWNDLDLSDPDRPRLKS